MLLQKKQIAGLIDSLTLLQTNIDGKPNMAAVDTAISTAIAALVDGAPTALDTLKELATMLQGEETALNALIVTVDTKLNKTDVLTDVAADGYDQQTKASSVASFNWLKGQLNLAVINLQSDIDNKIAIVQGQVTSIGTNLSNLETTVSDLDSIVSTVEDLANNLDTAMDGKVDKASVTDLAGVTPDPAGRVAGFASLEALSTTVGNLSKDFVAKVDITDLPGVLSGTTGQVAGYESVVALQANKLSGIKNHRIDTDLDIAAYVATNSFNFPLPTNSTQALEVKINGQSFVVGSGEAFSINGSTAGDGKYATGDSLALDGTKLGFTLEATDKIYVTLVSTL